MKDTTLLLIDNRLKSRSTIYQWCNELLGPSRDITGFEQGGINSGDFYKLYNNEQLKQADASELGVSIGSTTISAVGEADDVVLLSDDIHSIKLLARLTEQYCKEYRVKLVPQKTKLLPIFYQRHIHLVNYAKLTHEVSIADLQLHFVDEAEHVGVIRSSNGNMSNVLHRIASHKKALAAVSSAGLTRGCRTNPAASLRIHNLYAIPVLFSGLGSLVLLKTEIKVLSTHLKNTVQRLQRLHENTPRAVVFLLAGCLPADAIIHQRQLSLFTMICHKPGSLLHEHAKYTLDLEQNNYSWFKQIRDICLLYDLPDPSVLLHSPPQKLNFKRDYKKKICIYWHKLFVTECRDLKSLKYFRPELYSVTKPHYLWTLSAGRPYESSKSTIVAQMLSGRYRSEFFCRHFKATHSGLCSSPTCEDVAGTLEHILISCPAYSITRDEQFSLCLSNTVMFPFLHGFIRQIINSDENTKAQFFLEPLAFEVIRQESNNHGMHYLSTLNYICRSFVFSIHREYINRIKNIS